MINHTLINNAISPENSNPLESRLDSMATLVQRPFLILNERSSSNYLFKQLFKLESVKKHPIFQMILDHFLNLSTEKNKLNTHKSLEILINSCDSFEYLPLPIILAGLNTNLDLKTLPAKEYSNLISKCLSHKFNPQFLLSHIELFEIALKSKSTGLDFLNLWESINKELSEMKSVNLDIIVSLLKVLKTFQNQFMFESNDYQNFEKIFEIGFAIKGYVALQFGNYMKLTYWINDYWNFNPITMCKLNQNSDALDSSLGEVKEWAKQVFEDPVYRRLFNNDLENFLLAQNSERQEFIKLMDSKIDKDSVNKKVEIHFHEGLF